MINLLNGKSVVFGVCGGIAAYKIVDVVSKLGKLGAEVDVIMTKSATKFVAPLTFRSITHRPVITEMFDEPSEWDIKHISLANKADIIVVAPATANIIGKVAAGIADDVLTTTIIASKAQVLFVPAMNFNMYANTTVQQNIRKLQSAGYLFMEPDTGPMAEAGLYGKGRLPEPIKIVDEISKILSVKDDLKDVKILVTAGPTREAIDPVRYISNRSSGKMGYSFAKAAAERGAYVCLISGPVALKSPDNVETINVITAEEMYKATMKLYNDFDVIVMLAAVADYKCAVISDIKLKKNDEDLSLRLEKTVDILKELGKKKNKKILIGACAETNDLLKNALKKIKSKNLDMIIANDVTIEGAGFEVDTNIIKLVKKSGDVVDIPLMSKFEAANKILDEITLMLINTGGTE